MKIKSLMSSNVVAVSMDDSLKKVKEIFDSTLFHHLLVVEDARLLGVISDRDLLKALSPNVDSVAATTKDLASLNKKAHQIMTPKPITLSEEATLNEAVRIFNTNSISCIPIVDIVNKPLGIVTWRDIMIEIGIRLDKLHQ